MSTASSLDGDQPLLAMTRVVDAPCATVFEQWLRPEQLARWWDTSGGDARRVQVEARPDGGFRIRRRSGTGRWTSVTIRETTRPERIVFSWGGEQAETETRITVAFADDGARTRVTLQQSSRSSRP